MKESLLIRNGRVVTLNETNEILEGASVLIEDGKITAVGAEAETSGAGSTIDAAGRVVMPGWINAHHHMYSSFARGYAPPGEAASNFKEILERLWWKVDLALEEEDVYVSALVALLDCIRAGCTTVIDHHASPSCCDGSLDVMEKAFREAGLNGCLCYEVSDRNRVGEGVEENERFIRKCKARGNDQIRALFGLHASMTIGEETLARCARIGRETGTGFHVHVAEDAVDQEATVARFGKRVVERFAEAGIAGERSIFVHAVHVNEAEMRLLAETGTVVAHNPESNMNNAVGMTPLLELLAAGVTVGLGTDGMASQMIGSARTAYLLQRDHRRDPRIAFGEAATMLLKTNREICARIFSEPRGILAPGALADVIVVDYQPTTPMTPENLAGHVLFGLNYARVDTTICRGKVLMEDGIMLGLDEAAICARSRKLAHKMWGRIA